MKFEKMQGAGNDFILIDARDGQISPEEFSSLAVNLCRRRISVGADGLIVILPAQEGGDFAMLFYNADGSLGEMCGNGARCVARYGHDHGLSGDIQRIETTAGLVVAQRIEESLYCVRLNDPSRIEQEIGIPSGERILTGTYVELGDPGIPHAVFQLPEWNEMDRQELRELGEYVRNYPAFPKGANVTFWKLVGTDHVKAITYERGVEDFTLSCGTGAGSTAVAMSCAGLLSGDSLTLDFPGGELLVSVVKDSGRISDVYLTGPTVRVTVGEYLGY